MQELKFEQVAVVSGGSKIKDMERMSEARKASQRNINEENGGGSSDWFSPGSGEFPCCFGVDLFKVNFRKIAEDVGLFLNPNLSREQGEAKELQ
jgi:hypothetical protein